MKTFIMSLFSTLKAKLYAFGALVLIAFYAYMKWLKASNTAKKEKIDKLKQEAEVSKVINEAEVKAESFKGYQEAIDTMMNNVEVKPTNSDKGKSNETVILEI